MADDGGWDVQSIEPAKGTVSRAEFRKILNRTFGPGNWVATSGYRSPGKENALRAEGAGTVAPGHVSAHSEGDEDDPGAFDFQVRGMGQVQAADKLAKADKRFTKVFAEQGHGREGAHIHATVALTDEPMPTSGDDSGGWQVTSVEPIKPPPAAQPRITHPTGISADIVSRTRENVAGLRGTVADVKAHPKSPTNALKILGSVADYATTEPFAAFGATADQLVRPAVQAYNTLTGQHADTHKTTDTILNALGMVTGLGEEKAGIKGFRTATEAKTLPPSEIRRAARAVEKARMAPPVSPAAQHASDVKYLTDRGVRLTEGHIRGGAAKVAEEKQTSSAYRGQATAEAHQRAFDDFNKAAFNQALSHIGQRYEGQVVGRDGVAEVGDKIDAVYDRALPRGMAKTDHAFDQELAGVVEAHDPFTGTHRGALQAAVDRFIKPRFGPNGVMTGENAKDAETDLNKLIRAYAGKGGADDQFAEGLRDLKTALMDNVARHSPPEVAADIKRANAAYRDYKMIESASTAASAAGGKFTPAQLVAGAKRGSTRGQFARGRGGDMQTLADAAQRVLGNKYPDPGTAGRLAHNRRGVVGAVIGDELAGLTHIPGARTVGALAGYAADRGIAAPAMNALTRHRMERAATTAARASRQPQNYLRDHVYNPLVQHRAALAPVNALKLISQQQP